MDFKRTTISMSTTDYEELKNYCDAKGFFLSQFLVTAGLEKVNAEKMLVMMRSLVRIVGNSDASDDEKKQAAELYESLSKMIGG